MIPRGVRFADELFSFIGGTDFDWAQPDWTVSQFTHHWRRENVLPFSDGDIEATITSRQTCDESGETWRLMVAKSRYRAQTMLLQQVVSLIETPFSDGRGVAETVTVSPSLRRRLAVNHPHILKSLDEGGTHRLKTTLVQVKRDHDASHAAYHECGRHLDAAATEQKKITITLGGKFPPERLLYETYRQSPYGMWHPVKDGARPLSVTVDYLYETVSFRINRDDPYSLKPPMNRPCSGPERWSTPEVFRILGPRMLGWNLMQVIMAIRDIKWEIPWDYSGFYVLPAREAFRASKLLPSGLNGALQHTATPVNAVPMMNTNRLSRREDPLDARRVRRCWSALTDTEKEGIRALKPEAWVHLSFGLREYRLLAALKYLPTCRSLGGYKEAHRNAEIDVGRREMERFLTPESEREDDIPF
ncbi:MAG: hypothetical protein CMO43_07495 [Verrucomicrobiales bacterium]|nr:hypothetical protein [Verrucomicrobiales bacterium]